MSLLLSLCMIVKNEENVLKRCLDSVKDGVDEIVIVDTGSTDQTKQIAKQYTDKVYDFEWTNSFADARNYAQSMASGQWILALDADEFVDYDNLLELKEELKQNKFDVGLVKIYNFTGKMGQLIYNNYHVRIYRNNSTIKYYRTIHEQLKKIDGGILTEKVSTLVVYHSGYLTSAVAEKGKHKRNKALINKEIKEKGQTGFDFFNFGNEYLSQGDTDKALDYYVKAYKKVPDVRYSWIGPCVIQIIQCLIQLKRYKDALNVIHDSAAIFSHSPEFKTMRARIYLLQGRFEDAEHEMIELIEKKDEYKDTIVSPDYLEFFPYKFLGYIYEKKEKLQKAVFNYSKAFHFNLNDEDLMHKYFSLLLENTSTSELYRFILNEKLLNNKNTAYRLLKVIVNLSNSDEIVKKLINHVSFNNNFGVKAKYLLINKEPNKAFQLISSLTPKQLVYIFNEGVFDFIDFSILCLMLNQQKLLLAYGGMIKQARGLAELLATGKLNEQEIDSSTYLAILARLIRFEQFDLFEKNLQLTTIFDKTIYVQIGHLLYSNDFYDLAISYYQEAGNELFDEKAYLNLINACQKNKLYEASFNFCTQAIEDGYYHFQILKEYAFLANKMNAQNLLIAAQQLSLECYPDSYYLSKNTLWGDRRKSLTLIYTPLSGSNVTALMRQIPKEINLKYQVNLIDQKNDLSYLESLLASDVIVTTEGNYPFEKKNINKNHTVLELWHGFPLKSMGLLDASEVKKEHIKNRWKNVDGIISYSSLYNQSMEKCFGITSNKFEILGAPRNDFLFQTTGKKKLEKLFNCIDEKDRIIFYMPTWRHTPRLNREDGNKKWNSIFDMSGFKPLTFEKFLNNNHYKLIVKLHPADERVFKNSVHESENIFLLTTDLLADHQLDVYDLLSGADMLITDYSSVYFDFLLLNRPIIFTPVDFQAYQESRGFILKPYESWTPGPKVTQQEELQREIMKSMNDQSYYQEERKEIKDRVHYYQDDHSTERVWSFIDQLLQQHAE